MKALKKICVLIVSLILFTSFNMTVLADSNDYVGWTWYKPADELSVQDFETTYKTLIYYDFDSWNGIADNASILSYVWRLDMVDQGKDIRFYEDELTGTTFATTAIYNKVLLIYWLVSFWTFTGTVDRAVITLDNRSNGLLGKTSAQQSKTIKHELGHTLALDHPDCGSTAIMYQGYSAPASLFITNHDDSNMIAKWD